MSGTADLFARWRIAQEILEALRGNPPVPPLGAREEEMATFQEAFLAEALRRGIPLEEAKAAAQMAGGLGALEAFLQPEVEEVMLRGGSARVLFRDGRRADYPKLLPEEAVEALAARVADATGRALTGTRRFVTTDLRRPGLGPIRLSAVLRPQAAAPAVNLRIFPEEPLPFERVAEDFGIPGADRGRLLSALERPRALLIAGPFAAGKTTLLNALLLEATARGMMPAVVEGFREVRLPEDRALLVEEPDPVRMDAAIADAVLRMRADLIAVGEITTPEEARRFMWAALVGRPALATLHGATAEQALALLRGLLRRAGEPPESIEEMLRAGLGGVALLAYDPRAHRRRWVGLFEMGGGSG
jgi:type IV secretory pathway ATPase VirB11/archaellum biosynthesis ATPase